VRANRIRIHTLCIRATITTYGDETIETNNVCSAARRKPQRNGTIPFSNRMAASGQGDLLIGRLTTNNNNSYLRTDRLVTKIKSAGCPTCFVWSGVTRLSSSSCDSIGQSYTSVPPVRMIELLIVPRKQNRIAFILLWRNGGFRFLTRTRSESTLPSRQHRATNNKTYSSVSRKATCRLGGARMRVFPWLPAVHSLTHRPPNTRCNNSSPCFSFDRIKGGIFPSFVTQYVISV